MFDAGREVWLPRGHWIQWFAGLCLLQQVGECQSTKAHATAGEHAATANDNGRLVRTNEGNWNGCGHYVTLFSQ